MVIDLLTQFDLTYDIASFGSDDFLFPGIASSKSFKRFLPGRGSGDSARPTEGEGAELSP
jgi:hypothetical protein